MSKELLTTRIENLLSALTPEVKHTIGPSLLRESLEEIRRLQGLIYDRLVHGEIDGYESDDANCSDSRTKETA